MISEKNILQSDSEGKNLAGKYLTYNGVVCQRKKNYISKGLGTKILPKPKHSYLSPLRPSPPPLPQRSHGRLTIFFFDARPWSSELDFCRHDLVDLPVARPTF